MTTPFMSSHPYLTLVILYTFTSYFSMHQSSHLAYLEVDWRVRLNPCVALLMSVEQIIVVLFLVWYGYRTLWYYPLVLAATGFPMTFVLTAIERAMKLHKSAWAISISGVLFVPVLLYVMIAHINATAG
jgi:hypothetical protein